MASKSKKPNQQEIDLAKIQIIAAHSESKFNFFSSFGISATLVIIAAAIGLIYQGSLSFVDYSVVLVIAVIVYFVAIGCATKMYSRDMKRISSLIKQIEEGNVLPSMEELGKKIRE